jgi:hypothetical protein
MPLVAVINRAPQLAVTKSAVKTLIASSARTIISARGIGSDGGFTALVPRDGTRGMLADLPMDLPERGQETALLQMNLQPLAKLRPQRHLLQRLNLPHS